MTKGDSVPDPLWLDQHRYLTVWKGEVVEVDTRNQRPLQISRGFIESHSVNLGDLIARAFGREKKARRKERSR